MFRIFKVVIYIILLSVSIKCYAAGGAQLVGIKGTLKNIQKAIESAIAKSEELYEQNAGATLGSVIDLLTTSNSSPFIDYLKITRDYEVDLKMAGASGERYDYTSGVGVQADEPLTQVIRGTKIRFIPILEDGENKINSWECLTNADMNVNAFLGANSAASTIVGSTSLISLNGNPGNNVYLSNCIYVDELNFSF